MAMVHRVTKSRDNTTEPLSRQHMEVLIPLDEQYLLAGGLSVDWRESYSLAHELQERGPSVCSWCLVNCSAEELFRLPPTEASVSSAPLNSSSGEFSKDSHPQAKEGGLKKSRLRLTP